MIVYVVMGATGEYSDHTEWVIHAYTHEQHAQHHVEQASARYRVLKAQADDAYWHDRAESSDIPSGANEWDRRMQVDYTGVNYSYFACEVFDTLTPSTARDPLT